MQTPGGWTLNLKRVGNANTMMQFECSMLITLASIIFIFPDGPLAVMKYENPRLFTDIRTSCRYKAQRSVVKSAGMHPRHVASPINLPRRPRHISYFIRFSSIRYRGSIFHLKNDTHSSMFTVSKQSCSNFNRIYRVKWNIRHCCALPRLQHHPMPPYSSKDSTWRETYFMQFADFAQRVNTIRFVLVSNFAQNNNQ